MGELWLGRPKSAGPLPLIEEAAYRDLSSHSFHKYFGIVIIGRLIEGGPLIGGDYRLIIQ